ncbi:radical SAM protein [Clostridium sp. YIM B02505]|uniref:Radical SAM protein n=1 Tax=Clostridium yunnanense TaxID=2800325 RepID=A0ABS1ESF6_9CLOT|nr:radical SAM protein [Clostridium yunnanense]MBK1812322.1 radical SAM protein [Clostridium yunnanense]
MVTIKDNDIVFSDYARFIQNEDDVIIINGYSGTWGGISASNLQRINYCINKNMSPLSYIRTLENEEEREELAEIFQVLIDEKMIKSSSEIEGEPDIKEVEFKLTNKCNLKCLHCSASAGIEYEDILSTKQMKEILDKIFQFNIESLLLTGGEPLIRKDIKILLQYIRDNYKGTVNLLTNGTLIDRPMASVLKEYVDAVSISLDGYDKESCEFVRGRGVYDKIINAIEYLKEVGFNKDTIILSMVSTYQNYNHIDDFYSLCEDLDVKGTVREFSALGRGLENYESIGLKDHLAFTPIDENDLEDIRESLKCSIFCKAAINKIMINEAGDLYPCVILENEEFKLGNIIDKEFDDIFRSEKYQRFMDKKLKRAIVDDKPKCKDCNVRYFCMHKCVGVSSSYYDNEEICEERCKQVKPYLNKVVWDK